jgi:copper chaperone CopZ
MAELHLEIGGMSCQHCVAGVKKALEGVAGVRIYSVKVGKADISFDDSKTKKEDIVKAIKDAGYTATN